LRARCGKSGGGEDGGGDRGGKGQVLRHGRAFLVLGGFWNRWR
jgi:hypothetical protein